MELISSYLLKSGLTNIAKQIKKQNSLNGPQVNKLSNLIDSNDLHVILIGTGTPIVVESRSGPCTAIVGGGHFVLIDVGPGTYKSCVLLGLPLGRLTCVILTHFHSDHIGDLGEIMTFSWLAGRKSKLPVYGPVGVNQIVKGFEAAYGLDCGYRVEHHKPILDKEVHGFEIVEIIPPKCILGTSTVFKEDAMEILAFEVDHFPVKPAYGFRINLHDAVVVVSGDTCKCNSLIHNSKNADIIVQEAMCCDLVMQISDVNRHVGNDMNSKFLSDIIDYHTDVQDCVDIAAECNTPLMLLTHLVPAPVNWLITSQFFKNVIRPQMYRGEVVMGEDGMIARVRCSATSDVKQYSKSTMEVASGNAASKVEILSYGRIKSLSMLWCCHALLLATAGALACYTGGVEHKWSAASYFCIIAYCVHTLRNTSMYKIHKLQQ